METVANKLVTYKPTITYDGHSVLDGGDFDAALSACDSALARFDQSKCGSQWGSDGVGYYAQKRAAIAIRHKSGVGPRKFKAAAAKMGGGV